MLIIKEDNLKLSVTAIGNKNLDKNALGVTHNIASQNFGKLLDKYFHDMNSYYRIESESFKIYDTDGKNYSVHYEIELKKVTKNDKFIRHSQIVDAVVVSNNNYESVNKTASNIAKDRFKEVYGGFRRRINEKRTLCQTKDGKFAEVQFLSESHIGEDGENNIAFIGKGLFIVCY